MAIEAMRPAAAHGPPKHAHPPRQHSKEVSYPGKPTQPADVEPVRQAEPLVPQHGVQRGRGVSIWG
jgi:hypothetical protein